MCRALFMPILCTFQVLTRILMTTLLAIEDIIRQIIQTVHSYISTCFHILSLLPICCVYICVRQYYCSNLCSNSCNPYGGGSNSSCIILVIFFVVLILILYYTFWLEDLLDEFGIPCHIFGKQKNATDTRAADKFNSNNGVLKKTLYHRQSTDMPVEYKTIIYKKIKKAAVIEEPKECYDYDTDIIDFSNDSLHSKPVNDNLSEVNNNIYYEGEFLNVFRTIKVPADIGDANIAATTTEDVATGTLRYKGGLEGANETMAVVEADHNINEVL